MAGLTREEMMKKIWEAMKEREEEHKKWIKEIREDRLKREELRKEKTEEIKNDSQPETEDVPKDKMQEQAGVVPEIETNRNQENIKPREGEYIQEM